MYSFAPSRLCAKYLILFISFSLLAQLHYYEPIILIRLCAKSFLPQRAAEKFHFRYCCSCDQQLLTSNYVFFAPSRESFLPQRQGERRGPQRNSFLRNC